MSTMQVGPQWTIRAAEHADWKAIADFNSRLALETEGKRLAPETIEAGVRALLSEPRHGRYFVACSGDRIVGQMMHTREWSDWRNGEIWWLQSVYVSPDHRRHGIFRTLYRHLEQMAELDPGVVGIRLYVERENAKAIEAYKSLGLVDAHYAVMETIFRRG
ncbi:GNAT family N-acetyltransferase [Schlesneria paludicola]|uniref:GNAT family N-acetyltransferase n=1 Tax=Schlesneria paludicola TaxID=360056 RepID=UPI000492C176|nr:GNAT family N-acetyltransferase [Schlesneria paludicola]